MADLRWLPALGGVALLAIVPAVVCVGLSDDDDDRLPRRPPPLDLPETSLAAPSFAADGGAPPAPPFDPAPPTGSRRLEGVVRDAAGRAVAGVEVTGAHGDRYDVSDDEGRFLLTRQPAATFSFRAQAPGYLEARPEVPAGADGVAVTVAIVLEEAANPAGVVRDAEGDPVEGATVACDDDPAARGETDAQGRFELPADAAGCRAVARHPNHAASEPVTLAEGPHNPIALPRPGSIAGTVRRADGTPIPTFVVTIERFLDADGHEQPKPYRQTFRHPQGRFTVGRLAAGRYTLGVDVGGRRYEAGPVAVAPGEAPAEVSVVIP